MTPDVRVPYVPARIEGLATLAMNLSWSWHRDARALFRQIDERLWHQTRHNPLELLRQANPARMAMCAADPAYVALYDEVMAHLHGGNGRQTWFRAEYPELDGRPVAYFCAEFGLHSSVPIYSGGLGVLAGDHCKSASDLGVPLIGLGLFYRKGYFDQQLRLDGWQESSDANFDIGTTPLVQLRSPGGQPWLATVETSGRTVHVGAWRMQVGTVPVYLLDTDFEPNHPDDRGLLSQLYAGGPGHRVRQEWLLGVGGVRVLRALGIEPAAWHANEGHAAFMLIERLRELIAAGASYDDAVREVRASSVFTTHTPVPAGHDFFSFDEVADCSGPVWEAMGLERDTFMGIGAHPEQPGIFHMTIAALRLSRSVNGVSRRHGQVSRHLWDELWPGRVSDEVPIGHITNGVHLETWMATPVMRLLDELLGPEWHHRPEDPRMWDQVLRLDAERLWEAHSELKRILLKLMREHARWRFASRWKEAAHVVGAGTLLDTEALTIGFARRFATYKRANLVFHDLDRLRRLLVSRHRPVQIVFAGKAHPADDPGKHVLQEVYQFTRDPSFEGRVAFMEDYDMHEAHLLVQGVDLWLNLPRVPMEASGTSGMKASLNGVPQLGTLDGWWQEGYDARGGWAIPPNPEELETSAADAADAERLYSLLEEQVVPLYYRRANNIPLGWVDVMRHAIRLAGSTFTARRMVQDYTRSYYAPIMAGAELPDDPPTA
ncbi:MAG TPA: alpha-glucan family phosphorylase [Gemmatimonadales bacterium]|nr:alpha-glucan family phosphorylase [Gemmatimonadales bacterium]